MQWWLSRWNQNIQRVTCSTANLSRLYQIHCQSFPPLPNPKFTGVWQSPSNSRQEDGNWRLCKSVHNGSGQTVARKRMLFLRTVCDSRVRKFYWTNVYSCIRHKNSTFVFDFRISEKFHMRLRSSASLASPVKLFRINWMWKEKVVVCLRYNTINFDGT